MDELNELLALESAERETSVPEEAPEGVELPNVPTDELPEAAGKPPTREITQNKPAKRAVPAS